MPTDADLAAVLDAAIGKRPFVDTALLTVALETLCRARDAERDAARRERTCLLIALVMGIKHPIGEPPWEALVEARGAMAA